MNHNAQAGFWLVCQLGAREHYAVARALAAQGRLGALITDAWVPPGHPLGGLRRSLRERFHPDLSGAPVHAANPGLLAFELAARLRGLRGWELVRARNRWFQRHAVRALEKWKAESEERKSEVTSPRPAFHEPPPHPALSPGGGEGGVSPGEGAIYGEGEAIGDLARSGKRKAEIPTVFAYSYAALEIFRWAKARGWRTVLGQIDAGPEMGRIMAALEASGGTDPFTRPAATLSPSDGERDGMRIFPTDSSRFEPPNRSADAVVGQASRLSGEASIGCESSASLAAPPDRQDACPTTGFGVRGGPPDNYWEHWRKECDLADHIVVNSAWARECLGLAGVRQDKVRVIPLAYDAPPGAAGFERAYPPRFDAARPLRLLFVGQVNYLKGTIPLLEAMRELADQPVELTVVGGVGCDVPQTFHQLRNVKWIGSVPRGRTAEFYQAADALVFPSFGDGFGLVQLEAQAWKLPVIASRNCGEVVADGVNGLRLAEVSGPAIATAVRRCLNEPGLLPRLSGQSRVDPRFSLTHIGRQLLARC